MVGSNVVYLSKDGYLEQTNSGNSYLEGFKPLNDNSIYRIASISKVIVAIGVLKLYDKGLVDLGYKNVRIVEGFKEGFLLYKNINKDKILLITGGTGSFGNAVLNRFLTSDIKEIRIVSRDEKKQDDMRHKYQLEYPEYVDKIKFYI